MKKALLAAALLALAAVLPVSAAKENGIKELFVVNDILLEVEMKQPLTQEELTPGPAAEAEWEVGPDVFVTGCPIPQTGDIFHDNVYRIPVSGLEPDTIYHISYKGQKAKTFKYYEGKEGEDKYKNRYGSYF